MKHLSPFCPLSIVLAFGFIFSVSFLSCNGKTEEEKNERENLSSSKKVNYDEALKYYDFARTAIKEEKYREAAEHYIKAAEFGFNPQNAYMSAIFFYLKEEDPNEAMKAANLLAARGYRDIRPFENDQNFIVLMDHPEWEDLKATIEANKEEYERNHKDPSQITIETSDISRFWIAFDKAAEVDSIEEKVEIYRQEYFNPGTPGLQDFTFMKMRKGIRDFVEFVENHRDYYEGVKTPTNKALEYLANLPDYFEKVKAIVPSASFSDFYFVIGRHTSFGTVSLNGSLIGLENVVDENTPLESLPESRQSVVAPATFLPFVLIHELIHTYQNTSNSSLLGATIVEGGADLITELAMGPPQPTPPYRIYGEANEVKIWKHFKKDMDQSSQKGWVGGVSDYEAPEDGWVRDLAYFVGYKITRAYYDQAEDKEQAIQDLLDIKDPYKILEASGYNPGGN